MQNTSWKGGRWSGLYAQQIGGESQRWIRVTHVPPREQAFHAVAPFNEKTLSTCRLAGN